MKPGSLPLCALALLTLGCRATDGSGLSDARAALPPATPVPRPTVGQPVRFREMAKGAGLNFRFPTPPKRPATILDTMGYGCAFLDYDSDGSLDILLVGKRLALYRGDGKGRFTDVTKAAGLSGFTSLFQGVATGDINNDGKPDLYISAYRGGLLLKNTGGKFTDVTRAYGLPSQPWGTSAAFGDLDRDGFLDLAVCNYVSFDKTSKQLCGQGKVETACPPQTYPPLTLSLLRNRGGAKFTVATGALGKTMNGNSLGVAIADYDGSGRPAIAVANDLMQGDLYKNLGGGRFTNIGLSSGTSTDASGALHAGMGIDWADADDDGRPDLFVTTYSKETKCLYLNKGDDLFEETAHLAGIGTAAWPHVAFGCKFFDADNDGRLDLMIANGHTSDNSEGFGPIPYREPVQFFRRVHANRLTYMEEPAFCVPDLGPRVGRGLAVGDYDNDGRTDVLIVDSDGGGPVLLHNETPNAGRWIGLSLTGGKGSPRDAQGARVMVMLPDGEKRLRLCQTGGSYLSASDPRIVVGLGTAASADVTIRWPSGKVEAIKSLSAGRYYAITEGKGRQR